MVEEEKPFRPPSRKKRVTRRITAKSYNQNEFKAIKPVANFEIAVPQKREKVNKVVRQRFDPDAVFEVFRDPKKYRNGYVSNENKDIIGAQRDSTP